MFSVDDLPALEPSFGAGDFLLPAVERLLESDRAQAPQAVNHVERLKNSIRGVEVHSLSVANTRLELRRLLSARGLSDDESTQVLNAWIIEGDFLLTVLPLSFTHAVGNPPYVRQELIPNDLMAEYRALYSTIYDRADLYIQRCLTNLLPGGTLGFICADRWMKNKYGALLREFVSYNYNLLYYVDMVDTPAFHSDVSAYPAITVIRREKPGNTRVVRQPPIRKTELKNIADSLLRSPGSEIDGVKEIRVVTRGRDPWILHSFDQLAVVRRLENDFPPIEESGCTVGIGVATGADRVFIGPMDELDVEPSRKLPLVKTNDLKTGAVEWGGLGVINPFEEGGGLVELTKFPRLDRYLERHEKRIKERNVAKKNATNWYRTIDRIYPELCHRPKLLIPDIKGDAHIVYEDGSYYPHHNLYYITSEEWDLLALQAVLRSGIAKLFVSIYSTKMRGGYLRFQAQYLRRIRLPQWSTVPQEIKDVLVNSTDGNEAEASNQAVFDLYRLDAKERQAVTHNTGNGAE